MRERRKLFILKKHCCRCPRCLGGKLRNSYRKRLNSLAEWHLVVTACQGLDFLKFSASRSSISRYFLRSFSLRVHVMNFPFGVLFFFFVNFCFMMP